VESDLKNAVTISLSKAACLVLFELLTDSYEAWRRDNPDDASADAMLRRGRSSTASGAVGT